MKRSVDEYSAIITKWNVNLRGILKRCKQSGSVLTEVVNKTWKTGARRYDVMFLKREEKSIFFSKIHSNLWQKMSKKYEIFCDVICKSFLTGFLCLSLFLLLFLGLNINKKNFLQYFASFRFQPINFKVHLGFFFDGISKFQFTFHYVLFACFFIFILYKTFTFPSRTECVNDRDE